MVCVLVRVGRVKARKVRAGRIKGFVGGFRGGKGEVKG